jgi:tRNA dimethylallyltransferase
LYTSVPEHISNPLICIVGPTGAGKSELAIRMAEELDGEIVNCDSLQIYKGFDIGTAKVPMVERRGIPHHLIDVVEPENVFTAGDYSRRARETVADITARGKIPVVAGGTGFYLRAFLDGLSPLPGRNDVLRERLTGRPLHMLLKRLDPVAAERIHENDAPKLTRALEVRILTGKPAKAQSPPDPLRGYKVRKIGIFPARQELYARLDARCKWMFGHGLVEEVEGLLRRGVAGDAKPFESLGYRQALAVVGFGHGDYRYSAGHAELRQAAGDLVPA